MNCYICNPNLPDNSCECEYCRYKLHPLKEFLREKTGNVMWTDSNTPFIDIDKGETTSLITGYIAGANLGYIIENRQLIQEIEK